MESVESILTEEKERALKVEKTAKEAENAAKEVKKTAIELQEKLTMVETRA